MKDIQGITFRAGSREEFLPGFTAEFPYIASRVNLNRNIERTVPWHWHEAVELFYIKSGSLTYETPKETIRFPAGSGGFVNANVLHMTKAGHPAESNIQLLHLFDGSLLAGSHGSRIYENYIAPIIRAPQIEIIPLFPENPAQQKILALILEAFRFSGSKFGYEITLREALSNIWLMLFEQVRPMLTENTPHKKSGDTVKRLMTYIHEHYPEKISVPELAAAAYISERECFRLFRDCLHTTPAQYMKNYRLQTACRMLADGRESVTAIGHACGLGSSSHFGKIFREYAHCTPSQYRQKRQNLDR